MNKVIEKIKNDQILNTILDFAEETDIYAVGGVLRDFYLDIENFDKDIIIDNINARDFAQKLALELDASFVPLDEENKIYRLVLQDKIHYIDVANLIGENIEEDLKRRDLTLNSIAINLKTLEIIDLNNGISDLKSKKIRHISEQNLLDDPLRMLRAYRFQAMLGFDLDKDLKEIIKKHAAKIHQSALERASYELLKLFSGDYSAKTLIEMNESGLLTEILPVVAELKKVPPNLHHHLNLFEHSIEVVNQIQKLYENSPAEVQEHLQKIDFGGTTRLAHLKLAGFLHDIGKPETWTIEEETGKHRFIKHDDLGAKMAASMLKNAKFSKKQIDYIAKMIKYHIYPSHVVAAPELNKTKPHFKSDSQPTDNRQKTSSAFNAADKIYMRFIRKMENEVIDVIILAMADRLSARGVAITDEIVEKNLNNLQSLLDFYLNIKDSLEPLPKLLSGEEIMEILQISPSPQLGEIIKAMQEAQVSGEISTREEALAFINKSNTLL